LVHVALGSCVVFCRRLFVSWSLFSCSLYCLSSIHLYSSLGFFGNSYSINVICIYLRILVNSTISMSEYVLTNPTNNRGWTQVLRKRVSNTNPTNNRGWTQVLRKKSHQFLLDMWYPSYHC
jgi:hypothetical protein